MVTGFLCEAHMKLLGSEAMAQTGIFAADLCAPTLSATQIAPHPTAGFAYDSWEGAAIGWCGREP